MRTPAHAASNADETAEYFRQRTLLTNALFHKLHLNPTESSTIQPIQCLDRLDNQPIFQKHGLRFNHRRLCA
jgi:hypothetical protein